MKNRLIQLTSSFLILHLILFIFAYSVLKESFIEYPAGETFFVFMVLGITFLNVIIFIISSMFIFIINAILFTIFMAIFYNVYLKSTMPENKDFLKYVNNIMLSFLIIGSVLLMVLNIRLFPVSFVFTVLNYTSFSTIAFFIVKLKLKKVYSAEENKSDPPVIEIK